MEKTGCKMVKFGLIGRNISYSFSKGYFGRKFSELALAGYSYENFDLEQISDFPIILKQNPGLRGLNVTIPYKEAIIPFLGQLDPEAAKIGAVNTIKINAAGLTGYNTDIYGFQKALEPRLLPHHKRALILGTGGASKAVAYVLQQLGIAFLYVSRSPGAGQFSYHELSPEVIGSHPVIINTTPLGTYPDITARPHIPYEHLSRVHLLFDLIYNPAKTSFLLGGEQQGAQIENGLKMLEFQAEKAWEIWNS
jgi:shikimate dehydrogenase